MAQRHHSRCALAHVGLLGLSRGRLCQRRHRSPERRVTVLTPRVPVNRFVRANALKFGGGSNEFKRHLPRVVGVNVNLPDGGLWHTLERMQTQ